MLNLLEQAACAVEQKNWSLLNQCLQQLPVNKNSAGASGGKQQAKPDTELLLALALEILETGDFHQRWEVAKVFPRLGSLAIAPLVNILADEAEEDRELRWFAARILGDFHHPAAIIALVDVIKTSSSEDLTAMAASALASLGASAQNATGFNLAIKALTDLLERDDTRTLAVKALSHIRHSEIIAPLLSVVDDSEVAVRTTAIEALSSFHDDRIPPVLLDALKDTAAPVRREATIGLGLRTDLREELALVEHLKSQLWDFSLEVSNAAAIALGRMGTDAAADALFEVLQNQNVPISLQVQIVRSLSWIETRKALTHLQQAIADRNGSPSGRVELGLPDGSADTDVVCQEIIAVLGRVENPDMVMLAAKILIYALNSDSPMLQEPKFKQALATSLGQLKDPSAIDSLVKLVADTDDGVKWHAIAALKKFSEIVPKLEAMSADPHLSPLLQPGIAIALENLRF